MNIGENIRKARKKAGLTQKELGQKMGISQAAIGQFENSNELTMKTINKVALALNINAAELFGFPEKKPTPADYIIKDSAFEDLLLLSDFELVIDEDDAFIGLKGHGKLYEITQADLDELENSTLDYFKFKLNSILEKSRVITTSKTPTPPISIAAHKRTDIEVTDEMLEPDLKIMEDEDF